MELSDIRDAVRRRTGLPSGDPIVADTPLTALINDAVRMVNNRSDWPWKEARGTTTTTANQATITISDYRKIRWLQIEDRELQFIPYRMTARFFNRTGKPVYWTEDSGSIFLFPTPDATYTVSYGIMDKDDATLVNDTDEPSIPNNYIDLLIAQTAVLVARRKHDREMERVHYAELMLVVASVEDDIYPAFEGSTPTRVGRRWR